jgi:uncharacterized protein (TIGR02246 family)
MSAELRRLLDENEIRSLAFRYAQAADRRDGDALSRLFVEDGAIVGSGIELRTRDTIAQIPAGLSARFDATCHFVFNHLITLDGDDARGEVYSSAHHVKHQQDGPSSDLIMTIIYRDRYVRRDGAWFFVERDVDRKWTQTQYVDREPERG